MQFEKFSFGSLKIDGKTYENDIVIDRGEIRKRKKKPSKQFRDDFGHTPLSIEEKIPWKCHRLVIGTGAHGSLPVMDEVQREAKRRKVEIVILPTREAMQMLNKDSEDTKRHTACNLLTACERELHWIVSAFIANCSIVWRAALMESF